MSHGIMDILMTPVKGEDLILRMNCESDKKKTYELASYLFFFPEMVKNQKKDFFKSALKHMVELATDLNVDRSATIRETEYGADQGIPFFQYAASYAPAEVVKALVSMDDFDVNAGAAHTNALTVFAHNPFFRRRIDYFREKGVVKEMMWQQHNMIVLKELVGHPHSDIYHQMAFRPLSKGASNMGDFVDILRSRDVYLASYAVDLLKQRETLVVAQNTDLLMNALIKTSDDLSRFSSRYLDKSHVKQTCFILKNRFPSPLHLLDSLSVPWGEKDPMSILDQGHLFKSIQVSPRERRETLHKKAGVLVEHLVDHAADLHSFPTRTRTILTRQAREAVRTCSF